MKRINNSIILALVALILKGAQNSWPKIVNLSNLKGSTKLNLSASNVMPTDAKFGVK